MKVFKIKCKGSKVDPETGKGIKSTWFSLLYANDIAHAERLSEFYISEQGDYDELRAICISEEEKVLDLINLQSHPHYYEEDTDYLG